MHSEGREGERMLCRGEEEEEVWSARTLNNLLFIGEKNERAI